MNAGQTIEAALRGAAGWGDSDRVDRLLAGHRAEVVAERDAEIMRWLGKKAREYRATGSRQDAVRADTVGLMASKISRGAVRPNNTRLPAGIAPTFFEPGRTYTSGTWEFRCVALSPSPTTGEPRALGWKLAPVYDVHHWHGIALDPDDWKHGGWTEATAVRGAGVTRPSTPDRINEDGSRTITSKRACNGCGQLLGDVTDLETSLAISGAPLPDVRPECPACAPTAPEPACQPVRVIGGDALCVDQDCDHEPDADGYCDEVQEHTVCVTHSEIANGSDITHAEPWPCKHTKAVKA